MTRQRGFPTKQRDKPCLQCGCGCGCGNSSGIVGVRKLSSRTPRKSVNKLLIDVSGSLQSWITDSNITVDAPFPENLRCIIYDPCECGKTVLLKNLFIPGIQFDRLHILVLLVINIMI